MNRRATPLFWFAPVLLGSCTGVEVPVGPDMSGIAEVYDQPTGIVDGATIGAAVDAALVEFEVVHGLGQLEFVTESLEGVSETIHDVASDSEGSIREIRGSARVNTICPGDEATRTDDPDNGDVDYTIAYEENRLEDTVWGTITECLFYDTGARPLSEDVTPGPGRYDGSMDIYLGSEVELAHLDFPKLLFRLDGQVRLDSVDTDVGMDFRVLRDISQVEVRVPATDGDVVFGAGTDAARALLRTRDTSYCCDFPGHRCAALDGDSCDDPALPGQDLTW